MGEGTSGKSSGVRVIAKSAGTKFKSSNNGSGEPYNNGTNSSQVQGADSWEMPNGRNMLETTDFWDTSEDYLPGMKTGSFTVEGNWNDAGGGLGKIQDAHDAGETIELACTPDEANYEKGGYEGTFYVSELNVQSGANDKATFTATFEFADGDGWSRLST